MKMLIILIALVSCVLCVEKNVTLPQVALKENEIYYYNIDSYFTKPNMEYKIYESCQSCLSYTEILTPPIMELTYNHVISTKSNKISFPWPSQVIHYRVDDNTKIYYLVFYTNDFEFSVYDISDYNQGTDATPITIVRTVPFGTQYNSNWQFIGCQGIRFRDDIVFYFVCWDMESKAYVVNIEFKDLGKPPPKRKAYYYVSRSDALYTGYKPGDHYTMLYNRYIFYPQFINDTKTFENFCYSDFVDVKPENYGCIKAMVDHMKVSIGIFNSSTEVLFDIGDVRFMGNQYMFVSEINYGLFVFRFDSTTMNYTGDCYLYRLNSGPNTMHFEVISPYEYQLTLTTVKNNDLLVFQPIKSNCNKSASEILKLDRIHAFGIPKYYAFGTFSAINSKFMINELYNSYEKTVSVRVSSREQDTMNDSTLKVLDLDIPISSLVFLGFIESFSNLFIVATSNEIRIYSIRKPYLEFNGYSIEKAIFNENKTYAITNYCVKMGNDYLGVGTLVLFPKDSYEIVKNYYQKSVFHFNLYDTDIDFPLEQAFLGSNLDLIVNDTFGVLGEDVKINISAPLNFHDEFKKLSGETEFMEISTYVRETGELRAFMVFIYPNHLFYLYQDFSMFDNVKYDRKSGKTGDIRTAYYTSSYLFCDKDHYRNDYLFAMSYDEKKPSFHVFIVSDIISWQKVIPLTEIIDEGCFIKNRSDNVNYFKDQNVFVINSYKKTWTGHKDVFFYYQIVNGSELQYVDMLETNLRDYTFARIILVQPKLYYRVHRRSEYVEVYALDLKHKIHSVEYLLEIKDGIRYLSGHTCGEYTVMEVDVDGIIEFHVFDIQDVLMPVYKMTLPGTYRFESLVKENSKLYACIDDTKIVIPMAEKGLGNDTSKFKKTYMFVYDLSKPVHTALLQKYEIGVTSELYSMKLVTFQGEKLLYISRDVAILTLSVYDSFVFHCDDKYIPYFLENEKVSFSIILNNHGYNVSQDITLIGIKSGLVLNKTIPEITLHVTSEMKYMDINVDDYFTGYRKFITVEYPRLASGLDSNIEPDPTNKWTVRDTNLVWPKDTMIVNERYVIASMQNENHVMKELIYLGNKTYLYIDCGEFLYLKIDQDVANLVSRYYHGIQPEIRASNIQYLPDYRIVGTSPDSLGTVIILTTIDQSDDIVYMCNVDLQGSPNCYQSFTYNIGHVVNVFLWMHPDTEVEYLIIGSVSHTSNFSLIFFFEENHDEIYPMKVFDYIAEISATTLQIDTFCLDSLEIFDNYLTFVNNGELYLLDIKTYLLSPALFSSILIRSVNLVELLYETSLNMFDKIDSVTELYIVDRCSQHVDIYVVTQYRGVLMIQINKLPFEKEIWVTSPLRKGNNDTDPLAGKSLKLNDATKNYTKYDYLITDFRLLHNYYFYDYADSISVVNTRVLAMLIRRVVSPGFHFYVLRIMNLMTHEESIVYRDFYIENVSTCVSISIEEDNSDNSAVTFSLLCDSTIKLYSIDLKEEMVINTEHEYWDKKDNYLIVNITQSEMYHGTYSTLQLPLRIVKEVI